MAADPAPCLDGVPDRVAGAIVEVDAAGERLARRRIELGQFLAAGFFVDTADQEAPPSIGVEQADGVADPLRPSRDDDDRIGPRWRTSLDHRQRGGEADIAGGQQEGADQA